MTGWTRKYRGDHFVGAAPRLASRAVCYTFDAASFNGQPITVVNTKSDAGFVLIGVLRIVLGAGEERTIEIPADADYQIRLGAGVRLHGWC